MTRADFHRIHKYSLKEVSSLSEGTGPIVAGLPHQYPSYKYKDTNGAAILMLTKVE